MSIRFWRIDHEVHFWRVWNCECEHAVDACYQRRILRLLEMLDEFVDVLQNLVYFVALQGLNQKPTITTKEKQ